MLLNFILQKFAYVPTEYVEHCNTKCTILISCARNIHFQRITFSRRHKKGLYEMRDAELQNDTQVTEKDMLTSPATACMLSTAHNVAISICMIFFLK